MSTVADYVSRRADYNVFRLTEAPGKSQQLDLALFTEQDGGQIVAGIQKLAQRYLLLLLTAKGSIAHDLNRGTTLLLDAEQGKWYSSINVEQSFLIANASARRQLIAEELDTDPLDERFSEAELLETTVTSEGVQLVIQLYSKAGTSYTFITPITSTLR